MTGYTYPLSLSDFLDRLPISSVTMHAPEQVEVSGTGGGEILSAEVGPRLWTGEFTLGRMTKNETVQAAALIGLVSGPGRPFMVTRTYNSWPQYDPDGTILGAATPVIDTLNADNRRLKISGLPANYVLTLGDIIGFTYGSSPTRYALHQVASVSVTASGAGLTDWVELDPPIRAGATTSTAVALDRPTCKAVLVPGSHTPAKVRRIGEGASFRFIQTLR